VKSGPQGYEPMAVVYIKSYTSLLPCRGDGESRGNVVDVSWRQDGLGSR